MSEIAFRNETADCPASSETDFPDYGEGVGTFALVLLVLLVVFYVTTIAWWLSVRRMDWIRHRSTLFMMLSAVGGLSASSYLLLRVYFGAFNFPCDVFLLRFTSLPLTIAPFIVRLTLFHNALVFNKYLVEQSLGGSPVEMFDNLTMGQSVRAFLRYTFLRGSPAGRGSILAGRGSMAAVRGTRAALKKKKSDSVSSAGALGPSTSEVETQLRELNESKLLFRFFLQTKIFGLIIFGFLMLLGFAYTIFLIFQGGNGYGGHGCKGCVPVAGNGIFSGGTLAINALVGGVMLYRVRKEPDPLGIKKELLGCIYVAVFVAVIIILLQADPGKLQEKGNMNYGMIVALAIGAAHAIQCPLQIVLAMRRRARGDSVDGSVLGDANATSKLKSDFEEEGFAAPTTKSASRDKITLAEVMQSVDGLRAWVEYLASEISTENQWLYSSVTRYAAAPDEERRAFALRIHNTFVRERSILQVNLSFRVRSALDEGIKEFRADLAAVPPPDFFNDAQTEIYHLMSLDSFPRFLKSPNYRQWRAQLAAV